MVLLKSRKFNISVFGRQKERGAPTPLMDDRFLFHFDGDGFYLHGDRPVVAHLATASAYGLPALTVPVMGRF